MSRKPTTTQQAPVVMAGQPQLEYLNTLLAKHPVILVSGSHNIIATNQHGSNVLTHGESNAEGLMAVIQSQAETIRKQSETISELVQRIMKITTQSNKK